MGLFSGGSSKSGSAQKWAQPFAKAGAATVQNTVAGAAPGLQNLTNAVQGTVPTLSSMFANGNAGVKAANNYATDVLGGNYMQGNPYLDSIINQSRSGITDQVNSQFSLGGRYGSGAHTGMLAKELGNMETGLRYQNYGDEMNRMASAAGMAPGLAQAEYTGLAPLLQAAGVGAELPYAGINALSGGLSSLFSGGVQKGPGIGNTILGGMAEGAGKAVGAAAMASDPRLKTAIEKIGEFADGLGIYHWNYIWGGPRHEGVMADEVAKLRPWALGPKIAGEYLTVNYGAL